MTRPQTIGAEITTNTQERALILFLRLAMGWTFLYAGISQFADPSWSAAGFLNSTKTFHWMMTGFAAPNILPLTNFMVKWGHLLIGLSLVGGLLVRVSAPFGMLLMLTYYLAHMDFPYIENHTNFLLDYHLVYIGVLIYLAAARAGHVFGLDGWLEKLPLVQQIPVLRRLAS